MRKNYILRILFFFILFHIELNNIYSQVGIGTTTPGSTLDIAATNPTGTSTNVDGILIPRVDRQRAQSMTGVATGTMIYVNSIATGSSTGTAINIASTGFYYYDGTVWIGMNNTTGQSSTSYFSTGSLSAVTSASSLTLIPGMTSGSLTIPSNSSVLVTADVGVSTNSSSSTGYSATDIVLLVDGSTLTNGGYRRIYTVNNTANQFAMQQASISQSLTLSAGSHTFALYAAGGGVGSSATVGGNNTSVLQGELTVTIIKK